MRFPTSLSICFGRSYWITRENILPFHVIKHFPSKTNNQRRLRGEDNHHYAKYASTMPVESFVMKDPLCKIGHYASFFWCRLSLTNQQCLHEGHKWLWLPRWPIPLSNNYKFSLHGNNSDTVSATCFNRSSSKQGHLCKNNFKIS